MTRHPSCVLAMPFLACLLLTLVAGCSRAPVPAPVVEAAPAPMPEAAPSPAPVAAPVVVDAAPSLPSFAQFLPSRNGFRFRNQFTGSPLPISLGGLEERLGVPNHYGLCGGMSFAAADYFIAGMEPPAATDPPARGEALYTYLFSRQVESLGAAMEFVPRFARWMSLPDDGLGGTRSLTVGGLGQIISSLERHQPVHLGLVLTSHAEGGMLWQNHQVLAYGVERRGARGLDIRIYDPNFPDNDGAVLEMRFGTVGFVVLRAGPGGLMTAPWPGIETVRRAPGRRDTPVRGVFEMAYSPRTPAQ